MRKWWRNFWDNLMDNEAYFIARVRAVVSLVSTGALIAGKRLAVIFNKPWLEPLGELIGMAGNAAAFLMRAGDKTPDNVKQLADQVDSTKPYPPGSPDKLPTHVFQDGGGGVCIAPGCGLSKSYHPG